MLHWTLMIQHRPTSSAARVLRRASSSQGVVFLASRRCRLLTDHHPFSNEEESVRLSQFFWNSIKTPGRYPDSALTSNIVHPTWRSLSGLLAADHRQRVFLHPNAILCEAVIVCVVLMLSRNASCIPGLRCCSARKAKESCKR